MGKKAKVCENLKIDLMAQMINSKKTSNDQVKRFCDKTWIMLDSGSTVNVANCKKVFPRHQVRPSKGSKKGTKYTNASGGFILNEGETEVIFVHDDDEGSEEHIIFQHAQVHLPILSVRYLVRKGCVVKCVRGGGEINFPGGKTLPFIEKQGVFFIGLDIKRPDDGMSEEDDDEEMSDFSRQGR